MNYEFSNFPLDLALNLVNIVVMFILVRVLAYKPVKKFLDARREKMDAKDAQADAAMAQAETMKAEYAAKLETAQADAQAQAQDILDRAQERADKMVAQAQARADELIARAQEQVDADREDALRSIREESVSMALDIAGRILQRSVNDEDTQNMANRFFKEIGNPASDRDDDA